MQPICNPTAVQPSFNPGHEEAPDLTPGARGAWGANGQIDHYDEIIVQTPT